MPSHALRPLVRRMPRFLCAAALGLALAASACATWSAVPETRVAMGPLYSVQPSSAWNSYREGARTYWTLDGQALQQLIFFNGIADGEPLFSEPYFQGSAQRERRQRFARSMDYFAIEELIRNTWSEVGWQAVESSQLRPLPFGPFEGFRVELSMRSPAGLEYRATAAGSVQKDRLYLVVYVAAALHSYDAAHLDEVERILASIQPL